MEVETRQLLQTMAEMPSVFQEQVFELLEDSFAVAGETDARVIDLARTLCLMPAALAEEGDQDTDFVAFLIVMYAMGLAEVRISLHDLESRIDSM